MGKRIAIDFSRHERADRKAGWVCIWLTLVGGLALAVWFYFGAPYWPGAQ